MNDNDLTIVNNIKVNKTFEMFLLANGMAYLEDKGNEEYLLFYDKTQADKFLEKNDAKLVLLRLYSENNKELLEKLRNSTFCKSCGSFLLDTEDGTICADCEQENKRGGYNYHNG